MQDVDGSELPGAGCLKYLICVQAIWLLHPYGLDDLIQGDLRPFQTQTFIVMVRCRNVLEMHGSFGPGLFVARGNAFAVGSEQDVRTPLDSMAQRYPQNLGSRERA